MVGTSDPNANLNCQAGGNAASYFINPTTNTIVNPGGVSSGGVIGALEIFVFTYGFTLLLGWIYNRLVSVRFQKELE